MSHTANAVDLFQDLKMLPTHERMKFFTLIANQAFPSENFTHDQVFGHLAYETFSAEEAALYLEVSLPTFRRYVRNHKIQATDRLGRNQLFATQELKKFKQALRKIQGG